MEGQYNTFEKIQNEERRYSKGERKRLVLVNRNDNIPHARFATKRHGDFFSTV
jgi:hypothetical protein